MYACWKAKQKELITHICWKMCLGPWFTFLYNLLWEKSAHLRVLHVCESDCSFTIRKNLRVNNMQMKGFGNFLNRYFTHPKPSHKPAIFCKLSGVTHQQMWQMFKRLLCHQMLFQHLTWQIKEQVWNIYPTSDTLKQSQILFEERSFRTTGYIPPSVIWNQGGVYWSVPDWLTAPLAGVGIPW